MPGKVIRVLVEPGQRVEPRETLLVLEAMKMETTISAPRDGTVTSIGVEAGGTAGAGQLLMVVE
jgi:biotin carboxyl carrier protein